MNASTKPHAEPSLSDASRTVSDRPFSSTTDTAFVVESGFGSDVYENRMFRHVQSPVKPYSTPKSHHSFYATLPQRLPTTVPIDDLREKDDPSMCLFF